MPVPKPPELERIGYHWSPTANRHSIQRLGLVPGRRTLQGTGFRAPYVCLSPDPSLAWVLSGQMFEDVASWDLWQVHLDQVDDHYEILLDTWIDTGRHYIKEFRVYGRIFKRDVTYVATRAVPGS